jgi:flavin reductase (DIM6/NTAB) family NADH-FMN oxidoreductase RutF
VPSSWEEIIFFCGHISGEKVDKFAETGLVKETATTIDAPRLSEALGFIECKVVDQLEVGDHTLFVGQVTYAEERIDSTRLHHIDGNLKDLVGTFE